MAKTSRTSAAGNVPAGGQPEPQVPVIDLCSDSDPEADGAESKRQRANDGSRLRPPKERAQPPIPPVTRSRASMCGSSGMPAAPTRTKKRRRSATFDAAAAAPGGPDKDPMPPRAPRQARRMYRTRSITAVEPEEIDRPEPGSEPEIVEPAVQVQAEQPEARQGDVPVVATTDAGAATTEPPERAAARDEQDINDIDVDSPINRETASKAPGAAQEAEAAPAPCPEAGQAPAGPSEAVAEPRHEEKPEQAADSPAASVPMEVETATPQAAQMAKLQDALRVTRADLTCAEAANAELRERVTGLQKSLTSQRAMALKALNDANKWRQRAERAETELAEVRELERSRKRDQARDRQEQEMAERRSMPMGNEEIGTSVAANGSCSAFPPQEAETVLREPSATTKDLRATAELAVDLQRQEEMQRQRQEAQALKAQRALERANRELLEKQRQEEMERQLQEAGTLRAQKAKETAKREQLEKQQQDALEAHRESQRREAKEKENMRTLGSRAHDHVAKAAKLCMPKDLSSFMVRLGYADFSRETSSLQKQLKLAKRLTHPDKQHSKSAEDRALAEETFKKLSEWEDLL